MTEKEWLACRNPISMVPLLGGLLSQRKVSLFAVAACRESPIHGVYEDLEIAVDCAERAADGLTDPEEFRIAQTAVAWGIDEMCESLNRLAEAVEVALGQFDSKGAAIVTVVRSLGAVHPLIEIHGREDTSYRGQCSLIRDIFMFRPVAFDPAWCTSTVLALAEGIYADRAFDRLPILADALEDAGCDHPDILQHCRGDGPHVRGCWVVDLILGKS